MLLAKLAIIHLTAFDQQCEPVNRWRTATSRSPLDRGALHGDSTAIFRELVSDVTQLVDQAMTDSDSRPSFDFRPPAATPARPAPSESSTPGERRFLNVGGGSKDVPVPEYFAGWRHELADTDEGSDADHLVDPRDLMTLSAGGYDAVYCPHVLEHFYPHDVRKILAGFRHVLRPNGFAEVRALNLAAVMKHVVEKNLDLTDTLYESPAGCVTVGDAIYGYHEEIEQTGEEYFAHRSGFTPKTLADALTAAGFIRVVIGGHAFNLLAYAFPQEPGAETKQMLNLPS